VKLIAGSILVGFTLLSLTLSGLSGGAVTRSIDTDWDIGIYTPLGIEILIWLFMAIGIGLMIWGLFEIRRGKAS